MAVTSPEHPFGKEGEYGVDLRGPRGICKVSLRAITLYTSYLK